MKTYSKLTIMILMFLVIPGCFDPGKDDDVFFPISQSQDQVNDQAGDSQGDQNQQDLMQVSGEYEFNTTILDFMCITGRNGTFDPYNWVFIVVQDGQDLVLYLDYGEPIIQAATVTGISDILGVIEPDGTFSASFTVDAESTLWDSVSAEYTITGTFSAFEWYGSIEFENQYSSDPFSCTYTGDFVGNMIQ